MELVKPKTRNCASKVNVERGASGSSGWAGRVGREPRAQSRGDWRRPGRADGRTVTREHAGPYTRPDPDPRPARRVGCRLRTRVSNANVEVFEPRPGPREGRRRGCFSAGRANNRAWRRRALREENPKPDANASSRRQVSRRWGIVQKTHLCGGACAASGGCCPEVAMV